MSGIVLDSTGAITGLDLSTGNSTTALTIAADRFSIGPAKPVTEVHHLSGPVDYGTTVSTLSVIYDRQDPTLFERVVDWLRDQSDRCKAKSSASSVRETVVTSSGMTIFTNPQVLLVEFDDLDKASIFKMFWSDHLKDGDHRKSPVARVRVGLF